MRQPVYVLDRVRRRLVKEGILEGCHRRRWRLFALHVRLTHVHAVIRATGPPRRIRDALKSFASRRLNQAGVDAPSRVRWTRGGSARHLFTARAVGWAIDYVLNRQGPPLEIYEDTSEEIETE